MDEGGAACLEQHSFPAIPFLEGPLARHPGPVLFVRKRDVTGFLPIATPCNQLIFWELDNTEVSDDLSSDEEVRTKELCQWHATLSSTIPLSLHQSRELLETHSV